MTDIQGTPGNDTLNGTASNDLILGGAGQDDLYGGAGDDLLDGGTGGDRMQGDEGDDTYIVDFGGTPEERGDGVIEQANGGTDTIRTSINWGLPSHVENIEAIGDSDLFLGGNELDNRMTGNSANQYFVGGGGNDIIDGGGQRPGGVYNGADVASFQLPAGTTGQVVRVAGTGADAGKILVQLIDGGITETVFKVTVTGPGSAIVEGVGRATWLGTDTVTDIEELHLFVSDTTDYGMQGVFLNLRPAQFGTFVRGSEGDDQLQLSDFANARDAFGGFGDDVITGTDAWNFIQGAEGDDTIDGGADTDGRDVVGFNLPNGLAGTLQVVEGADGLILVQRVDGALIETLLEVRSTGSGSAIVTGVNSGAFLGTDTLINVEELHIRLFDANGSEQSFGFVRLAAEQFGRDVYGSIADERIDLADFPGAAYADGDLGDDQLIGNGDANDLHGGAGNDTIDGGADANGSDNAQWRLDRGTPGTLRVVNGTDADEGVLLVQLVDGSTVETVFRVTLTGDGSATVEGVGRAAAQGIDTVTNIEGLHFNIPNADWSFNPAAFVAINSAVDQNGNTVFGSAGDDVLDMNDYPGATFAHGEGGNDLVIGTIGNDWISGGEGNDIIQAGAGADIAGFMLAPNMVGNLRVVNGTGDDQGLLIVQRVDGTTIEDLFRVSVDATGKATVEGVNSAAFLGIDEVSGVEQLHFFPRNALPGAQFTSIAIRVGTPSAETINGFNNSDVMFGGDGADRLFGNNGDDAVIGETGDDILFGGAGNDRLEGGTGNDALTGGAGDDLIDGGDGFDRVAYADGPTGVTVDLNLQNQAQATGRGNDTLAGIEYVTGSFGNDLLIGDESDNNLFGTQGNDTIFGNGGDDLLLAGVGSSIVDGGEGNDSFAPILLTGAGDITLDLRLQGVSQAFGVGTVTLTNIENIMGGANHDTLIGDDQANILGGGRGDDRLEGGAGDDRLYGDGSILLDFTTLGASGPISLIENFGTADDEDELEGGIGDDYLDGGEGFDAAYYENATGSVTVDLAAGTASGADGNDTLVRIEGVAGSAFADTLSGDDGDNGFRGGAGADVIDGRGGVDTVTYDTSDAAVQVNLNNGTATGGHAAGDRLSNIENVEGSAFNDFIQGNAADNLIEGGDGFDQQRGNAGNDQLFGEGGDDLLRGGTGVDHFDGGANTSEDTVQGFGDRISFFELTATQGVIANISTGIIANDGFGNAETMTGIESLGSNTAFNDSFTGDEGRNYLFVDVGDEAFGLGGDDVIFGSSVARIVHGGAGDDFYNITHLGGALRPDSDGDGIAESLGAATAGVVIDLALGTMSDGYGFSGVILEIENIGATGLADIVRGDAGANKLYGNDGDDLIEGRAGDDLIAGENGNDTASYAGASGSVTINLATGTASGADGNDTLLTIENVIGSAYADTITGDDGDNRLTGGAGADFMDGGAGIDTLSYVEATTGVGVDLSPGANGSPGPGGFAGEAAGDKFLNVENVDGSNFDDSIYGNNFDNALAGRDGQDLLTGWGGNDQLSGGSGNDYLIGGAGDDLLDGGTGFDRVGYSLGSVTGVTVDLSLQGVAQNTGMGMDTLIGIEHVSGTRFDDVLTGNDGDNWIWGGSNGSGITGNDILSGGGGNDHLQVGFGNHQLDGGSGSDTLGFDGNGTDIGLAGVTFSLALQGSAQATGQGDWTASNFENLSGSTRDDRLTGDDGNNVILGSGGSDVLVGGAGNDVLRGDSYLGLDTRNSGQILEQPGNGAPGDDLLEGGLGDDELDGGAGIDTAVYANASGSVTVDLGAGTASGADGNDTLTGIENLTGSVHADVLLGSNDANWIEGGDGDDALSGRLGNDTLLGGNGSDFMIGGAGNDTIDGGSGVDDIATYYLFMPHPGYFQVVEGTGTDAGKLVVQYHAAPGGPATLTVATVQVNADGSAVVTGLGSFAGQIGTDVVTNVDRILFSQMPANPFATPFVEGATHINIGTVAGDTIANGDAWGAVIGLAGNDIIDGGNGSDVLDGGAGIDTLNLASATAGVTVNLAAASSSGGGDGFGPDVVRNFENVSGSAFNDFVSGDGQANHLAGGAGDDNLSGAGGNDVLVGGSGNDRLDGGTGIDTADYGGTTSGVTVNLFSGVATGEGSDTLIGIENLIGGSGDDFVTASLAANKLEGGSGIDTLSFESSGFGVTVNLATGTGTGGHAQGDLISGFENLRGSALVDRLTGDSGANHLQGFAGNDFLTGGGGGDRLDGGAGADTFIFSGLADSPNASPDLIENWSGAIVLIDNGSRIIRGRGEGDKIDLRAIDANASVAGDQAFTFVGAFTGAAGQVTAKYDETRNMTSVLLDANGDGFADMTIDIVGQQQMTGADFFL